MVGLTAAHKYLSSTEKHDLECYVKPTVGAYNHPKVPSVSTSSQFCTKIKGEIEIVIDAYIKFGLMLPPLNVTSFAGNKCNENNRIGFGNSGFSFLLVKSVK